MTATIHWLFTTPPRRPRRAGFLLQVVATPQFVYT